MNIIAFFLRHSRKIVLLSIAAGALSGMCNAALLAVINSVLKTRTPSWAIGLEFCRPMHASPLFPVYF